MKFAMKSLVAAAAIAALGAANAAGIGEEVDFGAVKVELGAGSSGALSFSPGSGFDGSDTDTLGGLIGALNVGNVALTAVAPATYEQGTLPDVFGDPVRVSATATAPVVGLDLNTETGAISTVTSEGGAAQSGSRIPGTLNGGTASVTNLRFDLVNNLVYADLVGQSAALGTRPAVDYEFLNEVLWTIGDVSGPIALPESIKVAGADIVAEMTAAGFSFVNQVGNEYNFTATNVISGLEVTETGFNFFRDSLALLPTGINALNAVNNDSQGWGTVTSTVNFTVTAVPEPSTYAMALVGLGLVGAIARRRRA